MSEGRLTGSRGGGSSGVRTDRSMEAASMASSVLVQVREEVSCPICLELMREPVSADCGHSFCKSCITSNCENVAGAQGALSCPVCRVPFRFESLRPNRHMANIGEKLRGLALTPPNADLCERHGEKLLLFCRNDDKVICWLCERSQEHRGHQTFLMEEIAQEYREILHKEMEKLRTDEKDLEEWKADIEKERTSWQNQIQWETDNVQTVFKKLRVILDSEEKKQLQELRSEEDRVLHRLQECDSELAQQTTLVRELLSHAENQLQETTMKMLQGMKDTMERSRSLTLKKPQTLPKRQRLVLQAPDLRGMFRVCEELMEVRRHWAYVTQAADNLPRMEISIPRGNSTFLQLQEDVLSVYLGSSSIISGKHYWEVDVSMRTDWILGISDGICSRTGDHTIHFGLGTPHPALHTIPHTASTIPHTMSTNCQPLGGYFVIRRDTSSNYTWERGMYKNSTPSIGFLSLTVTPKHIGVFLDYEAHTLSFYSVTDHGSLIYKFSNCCFSGNIFPLFSPGIWLVPVTPCGPDA